MNKEEYPKYQLIDNSEQYLTYRKYLDGINYEDIDIEINEVPNLKQALIDIREYCKIFMPDDEEWQRDILQIIDKALGDDNSENS